MICAATTRSLETHPLYPLPQNWGRATKTKPILAKHIQHIIIDDSVSAKLLLQTIEGEQMLKANSIVCLGANKEPWQQTAAKLLAKYAVTDIDPHGWMVCTPKPDNEVDVVLVPYLGDERVSPVDGFSIYGHWGEH